MSKTIETYVVLADNCPTVVMYQTVDEALVRQSLIDAIDAIEKIKHNEDMGGWFAFNSTAQMFLINSQGHLNKQLDALLRGTYLQFLQWEIKEGKRRSIGACV